VREFPFIAKPYRPSTLGRIVEVLAGVATPLAMMNGI
jgi:hypothetical protein